MRALAADTPLHIEAETIAILRGMTPAQKAAMLTQMGAMSDQLALTGIRMQRPQATPAALAYHLALRRIPQERHPHALRLLTELPAMSYPANPVAIAVRVGAILERLGIRYYVGGSFASSIFGEYRTTRDIDVIIQHPGPQHRQLLAQLQAEFRLLAEDLTTAMAQRRASGDGFVSFAMYDQATGYQIDMFLAHDGPYERMTFLRAFPAELVEGTVWVSSAEDSILAKLRWYALTPSDSQWRDVQAMVRVQGASLDSAYLRTWADALGIAPLLAHALAGEPPPAAPSDSTQLRLF
jgi:hypothetical protein